MAKKLLFGICLCLAVGLNPIYGLPQNLTVNVTADNAYAIYTGTSSSVTSLLGSATNETHGEIINSESFDATIDDSDSIYIAAWSDGAVAQGFLADFFNNTTGATVLSGDSRWEVTATGINLHAGLGGNQDPPPTLSELSTEIEKANAGNNASLGWQSITASEKTNAEGGILNSQVSGIDPQARWMWYDSGDDGSTDAPFDGFNHDEYLIFRMASTPPPPPSPVPEPTTFAMFTLALLCVGIIKQSSFLYPKKQSK